MKFKKITSFLCITALLVSLFSSVTFAASGDLVYEMTKDEVEAYAKSGEGTDFLQNAGGGVKSADGTSLKITGRANDYDSVDIKADVFKAGVEYTIIAKVHADSDQVFKLNQTKGPYSAFVTSEKAKSATLTYKYTSKDAGFGVRVQTDASTANYWIDSIKVYEGDPPAAGAGNPTTGDSFAIYLAIGALAVAGCGALVLSRKTRNAN